MSREVETVRIVWNDTVIEIGYEANWLGGGDTAHLAITSIIPERRPLPFTETGYRSHFTTAEAVDEAGGPAAFVMEWLEIEGQNPSWRKSERRRRQLSLF